VLTWSAFDWTLITFALAIFAAAGTHAPPAAQGFFAAHGFAAAHGFFAAQGFLAAHGFFAAQGFVAFMAQGFFAAQGFAPCAKAWPLTPMVSITATVVVVMRCRFMGFTSFPSSRLEE
jgi:hypothetical protein